MKKIGERLFAKGLLNEVEIEEALRLSREQKLRFGEACLKLGLVEEKDIAAALAEQYGLELVDLDGSSIDEEALEMIPMGLLSKSRMIPVRRMGLALIAISDPTDLFTLDNVERAIRESGGKPGRIVVAPCSEIERLFKGMGSGKMLREAAGTSATANSDEASEEVLSLERLAGDSSPAVRLVNTILFDAVQKRASDIHLETGRDGFIAKYRIDGVLHKVMEPMESALHANVISRLKVMSSLDISERRIPQDGRFRASIASKAIDFRLSIMPSVFGEDAVIRILDKEHISREFEELRLAGLGFRDSEISKLKKMIREPYGMVLVTGPTGSGKTTTLYAALSEINTGEDKIITIEDPVEYELKGIVQIQVNEKKGLTFARGLRSILRHDPDKVLVGEIRDAETAQIAIQAALTGHLVFTTVHANNVFDVIGRFIHMGIEPYNFVSALNCILAQRLLRMICPGCKRKASVDRASLAESGLDLQNDSTVIYEGAGCGDCHYTGYRGRKAIVEILDLTDEIRDMIADKKPISEIRAKAVEGGMKTLRQAAVERVLSGETTLKEINRVTFVE